MAIDAPKNSIGKSDSIKAEVKSATGKSIQPIISADVLQTVLIGAVALGLLLWLAWDVVLFWSYEYSKPESYYSHGPLIPFMSLFIIWAWRERFKGLAYKPDFRALILLIPTLAFLIVSIKMQMRSIESLGLMCSIWAGVWLVLGAKFFRVAWFPLLFLGLMMPLPGPVLNDATLSLQSTSTDIAAKLLNLISFTNTRDGNIITMSNFSLFVDVPCSGFKTLLALFTFNAFLASVLDGPLNKRLILFFLCAPMALIINAVRITLIGIVGECLGTTAAHIFHDWSGVTMLVLGFVVLFSIARLLGCKKFAGLYIF